MPIQLFDSANDCGCCTDFNGEVAFTQECSLYTANSPAAIFLDEHYDSVLSTGEFTLIYVFKFLSSSSNEGIIGKWNTTGNQRSFLFRDRPDGGVQFINSGNGSTTNVALDTDKTTIMTGGWQMLGVRFSLSEGVNTDRIKIFDQTGLLASTYTVTNTVVAPYDGTAPLLFSNAIEGGNGIEDYVNRGILLPYAASEAEILDFWNSGAPKDSEDAFSSVSLDLDFENATFSYDPGMTGTPQGWEIPNRIADGVEGYTKNNAINSGDLDCNENPYV